MQNCDPIDEGYSSAEYEEMQNSECRMQNSESGMQNCDSISAKATGEEINPLADEARPGGRAHLTSSVPRAARLPKGALTKSQLAEMREIFGTIDDAEIHRLYKRVTK